jgi:putative thioredoxin
VILAKVNVDENPAISAAFKVQSIPAVYALKDGAMFDGFVGAQSEHVIAEFVQSLMPEGGAPTVESLVAVGDEASLREAFVLKPGDESIAILLAELLLKNGDVTGALGVLALVPETDKVRVVLAAAGHHGSDGSTRPSQCWPPKKIDRTTLLVAAHIGSCIND